MDRYRLCNYHGLSSISLFFPLSSTHDSRYDRFSLFNQLLPSSRVLPDGQSGRKSRSYMVSDCFVSPDFDTWCFVFGHLYSFPLLLRRWILVRTISCDLPFVTLSWCLSRRDPSIGIQKKLSSHDFAGLVRLISWLHYRLHICVWGGGERFEHCWFRRMSRFRFRSLMSFNIFGGNRKKKPEIVIFVLLHLSRPPR